MSGRIQPGDKVVCITAVKESSDSYSTGLVAGREYTVKAIHACRNSVKLVAVGIPFPVDHSTWRCIYCLAFIQERFHYAWRFIKLDPDFRNLDIEVEAAYNKAYPRTITHQGNTK